MPGVVPHVMAYFLRTCVPSGVLSFANFSCLCSQVSLTLSLCSLGVYNRGFLIVFYVLTGSGSPVGTTRQSWYLLQKTPR